jgi:hypothetical protein
MVPSISVAQEELGKRRRLFFSKKERAGSGSYIGLLPEK